jgi:hypothetical protein
MAKKRGSKKTAARKAAAPEKDRISTEEVTDAINDVLNRLKRTGRRGWSLKDHADAKIAEFLLGSALKKIGCPPTQSYPKG